MTGMDTRIGYPNEHLASGNTDEITSPVFATGVGLVIKGLEKGKINTVTNHSEKVKGNFFDVILKPVREFFEDDSE
jgi:cell division protein FtsA